MLSKLPKDLNVPNRLLQINSEEPLLRVTDIQDWRLTVGDAGESAQLLVLSWQLAGHVEEGMQLSNVHLTWEHADYKHALSTVSVMSVSLNFGGVVALEFERMNIEPEEL